MTIKFAKKNKILVGPGKISAAGSLVAYSLGITGYWSFKIWQYLKDFKSRKKNYTWILIPIFW